MKRKRKEFWGCRLTVCLLAILFLGILIPLDAQASSLEESIKQKQNAISEAQAEKKKLQSGLSDIKAMVKKLEQSKNNLETYVVELDKELASLGEKIEELQQQITEKKAEVEQARKDTEQAQEVADQQYDDMKDRLRYLYVNGSQDSYLTILLSSESIADMLNQAQYVEKLSAYDRRKLLEYRQNVEYLNLCRETLEEEEAVLKEAEEGLQKEQESVNTLIQEKSKQIAAYESDISSQEESIEEYEAQIAAENATIAELEKAVAAEKAQLAEQNKIKYDGGMFQMPCPGYKRVSSDYGNRLHPTLGVYKFHNGVDFAASTGTPILAAYDGKVVGASYNSSMGNYVMIDHGDGLYTIYMHASKLYVSSGQMVSKGEKIAAVGSTGRSTGPHLHFGVRLNGAYVSPWNYLK
ncbi:MAG: peptidoglycan DD-metalloendopeptidase family protein [Lachnospiraceae bacterium]|nr:peptidoglycan DD-metalloendopeptidase family protein [Lachnospiraceae bacterium]